MEVTLLSNFIGVYPLTKTIRRQTQSETKPGQISVQQPDLIRNYNMYMGEVDLHDQTTAPQYAQRNGGGHCGYQF